MFAGVRTISHLTLTPSSELTTIPEKIRCSFIPEEISRHFSLHSNLRLKFPNFPLMLNLGNFFVSEWRFSSNFNVNKASVTFPRTSHVLSLESIDSSPDPSEQTALDNITSQPWSDAIWPRTTPSTAYFHFVTLFSVHFRPKSQDKVQKGVVRGRVASDHGWPVILSRPSCSKGDEPGFEAIGGREPQTARPQQPAIFWHFCGNFLMSRGLLLNLPRQIRYQKRTGQIFCTRSNKKGLELKAHISNPTYPWFHFWGVQVHP